MAKKIDLTKRAAVPPAAKLPVRARESAPAAQRTRAASNVGMPLPVGQPINFDPARLTPQERRRLIDSGWDGQSAIPNNFAELDELVRAQLADASDLDNLPLPVEANRPPLHVDEVDIRSLPPAKQQEYQELMAQMFAEATQLREEQNEINDLPDGMDPSVKAAIMSSRKPQLDVVDDRSDNVYASGQAKTFTAPPPDVDPPSAAAAPAAPGRQGPQYCVRCGHDQSEELSVPITESDKELFLDALCSRQPVRKTYNLLRGRLCVTVRSLHTREWDMIWRQVHTDELRGRILVMADKMELVARYRMALQVSAISGVVEVVLPQDVAEWDHELSQEEVANGETVLRGIYESFAKHVADSEHMHRLLQTTVGDFNTMMQSLEKAASNANF